MLAVYLFRLLLASATKVDCKELRRMLFSISSFTIVDAHPSDHTSWNNPSDYSALLLCTDDRYTRFHHDVIKTQLTIKFW